MTFCDEVPKEVLAQHAARKVAAENAFTAAKAAANAASAVTAARSSPSAATTTTDATAGEWDMVHAVVADKLAPVVENVIAEAARSEGAGAAGTGRTRLAKKKATQGGRVKKELNQKSKKMVNDFIRDLVKAHPNNSTFRKKNIWYIRRDAWGTFVDHIRFRAELSVDGKCLINLQKKDAPVTAAPAAALVLPSSTVGVVTPSGTGPSDSGLSVGGPSSA